MSLAARRHTIMGRGAVTLSFQSTVDSDTAHCLLNGSSANINSTYILLNRSTATSTSYMGGVRFSSVTVPAAATIIDATFNFQLTNLSRNTTSTFRLYGDKSALSPATFGTGSPNRPYDRTRTTAYCQFTSNVSPASTTTTVRSKDYEDSTNNLKGVIQEIVNQASWTSGNALALIPYQPTGTFGQFEMKTSQYGTDPFGPTLEITYI